MIRFFTVGIVLVGLTGTTLAAVSFTGTWVNCSNPSHVSCKDQSAGYVLRQRGNEICGVRFEKGRHAYGGRLVGHLKNGVMAFRACEDVQWICTDDKWSQWSQASIKDGKLHVLVKNVDGTARTREYVPATWSEPMRAWAPHDFVATCEDGV